MATERRKSADNDQVIKALADPMRVRILGALGKRTASPSDIAREIDADLSLTSYHFRVLRDAGLIQRVREAHRRGARETYYQRVDPPVLDQKVWGRASEVIQQVIVQSTLRTVGERVDESARSGGFEREGSHLLHLPMMLDEAGWKEVSSLVEEAQIRFQEVGRRAEQRLDESDEEPLDCSAVLMLFTSGKA
jgi:DNA-binding transcriptional ArsR family regulator